MHNIYRHIVLLYLLTAFYQLLHFSSVQVDVFDEGSYTCSIQTKQQAKTSQVYLIVQGRQRPAASSLFTRVS